MQMCHGKRPRQQQVGGKEAVNTAPDNNYFWICGFHPTHNDPQYFMLQK
jgi:hypothetical protein